MLRLDHLCWSCGVSKWLHGFHVTCEAMTGIEYIALWLQHRHYTTLSMPLGPKLIFLINTNLHVQGFMKMFVPVVSYIPIS